MKKVSKLENTWVRTLFIKDVVFRDDISTSVLSKLSIFEMDRLVLSSRFNSKTPWLYRLSLLNTARDILRIKIFKKT